jgi:hypothetical protein
MKFSLVEASSEFMLIKLCLIRSQERIPPDGMHSLCGAWGEQSHEQSQWPSLKEITNTEQI